MFLIFLLLAFFDVHQTSSMHTPKASSFSNLTHNNNFCQLTPRLQTCKVINGSRAQSFEVENTKETENKTKRRLFASSSNDDQMTDNDKEEILQLIEENSKQKRINEKTNNNSLGDTTAQQPPLSSPILVNSQMLERSFRKEKYDENQLKINKIEDLDKDLLNHLIQSLNKDNWTTLGSLNIDDILTESLLGKDLETILYSLNENYNFLVLKDKKGHCFGWLIYEISEEDEAYKIDLCIINKNISKKEAIKNLHSNLKEILHTYSNFKKIIADPLNKDQSDFYLKNLGFTNKEGLIVYEK